jgi:hypothetical protein
MSVARRLHRIVRLVVPARIRGTIRWLLLRVISKVWKPGTVILRTKSLVLLRNHYYSPVPDPADVAAPGYWERRSTMPGIDLGAERARHLLDRVFPPLVQAFRTALPNVERSGSGDGFYLINGVYMAVDAHVYWAMIHHLRPRRILEIGSGMSTLVALEAVRALGREGIATELTCVEPFPSQFLRDLAGQGALTLLEQPVQEIPLERFTGLEANDILFIDSTHVLREGSDVQYEYLEVLPRLAQGVHVHVHDISLPRRYPRAYWDGGLYWNEQYLLQAYLVHNARAEVVWPGNYMMLTDPERMLAVFPEIADMRRAYPQSEPTAFWFKIT